MSLPLSTPTVDPDGTDAERDGCATSGRCGRRDLCVDVDAHDGKPADASDTQPATESSGVRRGDGCRSIERRYGREKLL